MSIFLFRIITSEFAVAEVIGEDEDDVGASVFGSESGQC
jgi:hypothetical protein